MKVLNVNHTLDPIKGGGTAERTRQMGRWLRRAGVDTGTLTMATDLSAGEIGMLTAENVTILRPLFSRLYLPRCWPGRIAELVRAADIVHLMCHWTPLNALVYAAVQRYGKTYVVCPAGALRISGRSRTLKRLYNTLIGRRIIGNATAHIAISPDEVEQYEAYGIDPADVTIIPNGICPEDFPPVDTEAFRKARSVAGRRLVLFMGRLDWVKGPDLLLEAFRAVASHFPEYDLGYAGSDSGMLLALRKAVIEAGLEQRVHFLGPVSGLDRSAAYRSADLLVIPSRHEAMSIVVLEAGICGTPVLATDSCGLAEVAKIGGGIITPATASGLANGLRVCLGDRRAMQTMGERLQQHVRAYYTWDKIVEKYLALYGRLLCETPPVRGGPREHKAEMYGAARSNACR